MKKLVTLLGPLAAAAVMSACGPDMNAINQATQSAQASATRATAAAQSAENAANQAEAAAKQADDGANAAQASVARANDAVARLEAEFSSSVTK